MKCSITSLINQNREIDYQFGGRKYSITPEEERDIKKMHEELFNKYQEIKRLTTKIT